MPMIRPAFFFAVGSLLWCVFCSPVRLTGATAQVTDRSSSGAIRSTITLGGHSLTVDFAPRSAPSFPAERSAGLSATPLLREAIGHIESTAPVTFARASSIWPSSLPGRSRLWLSRSGQRARLELETTTETSIDRVTIDLLQTDEHASVNLSVTLMPISVTLMPINDRSAWFVLAWGGNIWTARFTFAQDNATLPSVARSDGQGDPEQYVRTLARTRTLGSATKSVSPYRMMLVLTSSSGAGLPSTAETLASSLR